MRIRTTTAAAAALIAVAFTVVGCSSDKDGGSEARTVTSAAPEASSAADGSAAVGAGNTKNTKDAEIPPEPTGAERSAVLAAIQDVNGNLIHDEDKALDAARNQCAALDGGAKDPDHSASQRFSYDGVTLTDDDGHHLNIGLRKTLCPES